MKNTPIVLSVISLILILQRMPAFAEDKKEVLPQHKEEVSAIYTECLSDKHGMMVQCIQKKVEQLEEDVQILKDIDKKITQKDWEAPQDFAARENKLPYTEENLELGRSNFLMYCAACHGAQGKGSPSGDGPIIPDLTNPKISKRGDGELFWKITEGAWPMPAFWEGDLLSEDDIWVLIQYVKSLADSEIQ